MDSRDSRTQKEDPTRSSEYLWDRTGEPDQEIQRLEALLGKFQHDRPAPVFPQVLPERRRTFFSRRMRLIPVAIAAAAVAVAVATFLMYRSKPVQITGAVGWNVSHVAGEPHIGPIAVHARETGRLGVGQVLETDQRSRASLSAENTGQIEVEPNTRLRLLTMAEGLKRIALDRGTIHTYIWAPPGQFVVDTPSAMTVDLGCAYTLHVDDSGAGLVRTSLGWVGFKLNGHESFIPAGAACATRPKAGPGTPYFEHASSKFLAALTRFDFEDSTAQQRAEDLAIVVGESRKRDALTLWHLLSRVDEGHRAQVFDRLQNFVPAPAGVTKEGILRLDEFMLDQWWNQLGFDDISGWRHWERTWSGEAAPAKK